MYADRAQRICSSLMFGVILKSIGPAMPLYRVSAVHCLPSVECWPFTAYPGRIMILSALIGNVSGNRIDVRYEMFDDPAAVEQSVFMSL